MLLTLSYVLLLALLRAWGAFDDKSPPERRAARPVRLEGRVVSPCLGSRGGDRLALDVERGLPRAARAPRVEAYLPRGTCERLGAWPGQRLALSGKLRPPRPALQPGEFDEAAMLAGRGVGWVLHAREARLVDAAVPPAWRLHAAAERARRSSSRAFRRWLSADDAALLSGLLFGDKGGLSPEVARSVRDAGAAHLLVASGTNVAFVVWGAAWALRRAGLRLAVALAPAAAAGAFYCLMAGGGAPQLRAYAAVGAGAAAAWWPGRDAGGLHALALSALAILAVEPAALGSVSFQMTYAAALALWLCSPWRRAASGPGWRRVALQALGASIAVQLALWPHFADVFGRGPVAGLLANALLVPAAGVFMAGGVLLWAVSPVPLLAGPAAAAAGAGLAAFKGTCAFFAALPWAAVELSPMTPGGALAWYAATAAVLLLPRWRPALAAAALALGVLAFRAAAAWAAGPRLEACFLSDRRGWAAWLKLPSGEHLLVDAGLAPARLSSALRALGAEEVSLAVVTSRAPSASRGVGIARRFPVRSWVSAPGVAAPSSDAGELREGTSLAWGEVRLSGGAPPVGSGRRPVEIGFRRFRLRFMEQPGLVELRRSEGGPVEFCILQHPAVVAPAECAPAGIRGVGIEGALWITTDGDRYHIQSQASGRPLGRPVL